MEMKIIQRKISELKHPDYNPRQISKHDFEQLKKSLQKFEAVEPVVINKFKGRENIIIGGNQRIEAAKALGWKDFPCYEIKLKPEDEKELNIRLNRNIGEWDFDLLANVFEIENLKEWGFEDLELNFSGANNPGLTDPDEIPEIKKTKIKAGNLFQLGSHRLLCGDSTNADDITRLMGDKKADMVFTDPPYGVNYEGKTKEKLKIKNDAMTEDELAVFIKKAFDGCDSAMRDGAYFMATVPAGILNFVFVYDLKVRGWLRQQLVWVKDSMVLGHSEYHYKHESILFGWKPGDRLKGEDRTKTSVWEFDRPKASREHPTMKPVEMWIYGIKNHTKTGDIVYEPFCGSGTTAIACEQTSRVCYGIELDPQYCQVIIDRWENFTGQKAKQIN